MLIHDKIAFSQVNGPGNRAVVWFQGCSLGCKGCWNPETHEFKLSTEVSILDIVDWVLSLSDVEGVTFSGGEPMQQAPALYLLMDRIRQSKPELSFGLYSGYSRKELEEGRFRWKSAEDASWINGSPELWQKIRSYLDFGILGRYNELVRGDGKLPLIGSLNQEAVFFTDRYKETDLQGGYEVTISKDGATTQTTGFPIGVL